MFGNIKGLCRRREGSECASSTRILFLVGESDIQLQQSLGRPVETYSEYEHTRQTRTTRCTSDETSQNSPWCVCHLWTNSADARAMLLEIHATSSR